MRKVTSWFPAISGKGRCVFCGLAGDAVKRRQGARECFIGGLWIGPIRFRAGYGFETLSRTWRDGPPGAAVSVTVTLPPTFCAPVLDQISDQVVSPSLPLTR